jgi:hypothetical protein
MLLQVGNTSKDQSKKKARGGIGHWVSNGQHTINILVPENWFTRTLREGSEPDSIAEEKELYREHADAINQIEHARTSLVSNI